MTNSDIVAKYYEIEQLEGGLAYANPATVKQLTAESCGVSEGKVAEVMIDEITKAGAG